MTITTIFRKLPTKPKLGMKQILIFVIVFLTLGTTVSSQVDLSEGLQAYLPFNGNAQDESESEHNTEVSGAILFSGHKGEDEKAYYFNGVDDFIQIEHSSALDFGLDQEFAISLWFKSNQSSSNKGSSDMISKWASANLSDSYSYTIRLSTIFSDNPGQITVARYDGNGFGCNNRVKIKSEPIYNDNEWHHIIFQRTQNNVLQLIIDCKLVGTLDDFSSCTLNNESDIFLGMRTPYNSGSAQPYKGALDELRIYDRSLVQEEVEELCSSISSVEKLTEVPEVEIYPVPSNGNINIVNKSNYGLISGKVYDIGGSLVMDFSEPKFYIEGPVGVYLLVLRFENGSTSTHRVVKSHMGRT